MMKSLRDKIQEYVQSAYLHGLPVENLDTGELEPPKDIADTDWIVDSILSAIKEQLPEKKDITLPTKTAVTVEDQGEVQEVAELMHDNSMKIGYNQCILDVLAKLEGGEQ